MIKNLSFKGLIDNKVKTFSKNAGISLALMVLMSFDANSQTKYEAEDAVFAGDVTAQVGEGHYALIAGFSGTGWAGKLNTGTDKITFTVNAPEAGEYTLFTQFNSYRNTNINLTVGSGSPVETTLNRGEILNGDLEWKKVNLGEFTLAKGDNTIEFATLWTNTHVDIDYIEIEAVAKSGPQSIYEAEKATLGGGVAVIDGGAYESIAGFSGTGCAGKLNTETDKITFTVNAPEAGEFKLFTQFSAYRTTHINVAVGSDASVETTLDRDDIEAGVKQWKKVEIGTVTLDKGENTIEFATLWTNTHLIIDYIEIDFSVNFLSVVDATEASFNMYPNPVSNGVLNIQTAGNVLNLVTITNLVGQEVFTTEFSGNSTQISTSNFNKGLYLVTIKSGNSVSTKKVIIE